MAQKSEFLLIAKGKDEVGILPRMANRHGLVAGATGTGKTVTLRVIEFRMKRLSVMVVVFAVVMFLVASVSYAGKTYQFTGKVLEVKDNVIVVDKNRAFTSFAPIIPASAMPVTLPVCDVIYPQKIQP